MAKIKPVSRLLSSSGGGLQSLLERAQYLQMLTAVLRETIDPALSTHITVANLRGDIAVVTADTPAWLSKIRYLAPSILQTLKSQPGLAGLSKIQLKVQPPDDLIATSHESRRASLSPSSSYVLEHAASGISDPNLADALRRLSRQREK